MEDDSFGAYEWYFTVAKCFGAFPYSVNEHSKRLRFGHEGPFYWLYMVNFAAGTFHFFFQFFQLLFIFWEGADMRLLIGQFTWVLLAALPMGNYAKTAGDEWHFVGVVEEWCHLERRIIGSTYRGITGKAGKSALTLSSCHFHQKDRFYFISRYYMVLGLIGGVTIAGHAYVVPDFPSYIYTLTQGQSETMRKISVVYQLWIYGIIWSNVYFIEVLITVVSSSVGHILETLSYKGGVVMTRWTCDHVPVTDLIMQMKAMMVARAEVSNPGSAVSYLGKLDSQRKESTLFDGTEDLTSFFPRTEMSRIIQNLVDIEFGLEGYLRVESLIEAFNHSFGRIIPAHQFVYLILLTIQGFNAIQYFSTMAKGGVIIYVVLMALFLLRMLTFFPAMGNLDHRSDSFIDSWMEGLRYIPKGKQSYELYWYRIKSCRLLDFRCGRYFNMERQTCLEFLFRVSEFVIVLLQISY